MPLAFSWVTSWKRSLNILLTGSIYYLYSRGYQSDSWYSVIQTLVYLQKTVVLLLQWLDGLQAAIPKPVLKLGDHAFGIFFIHLFTMGGFIQLAGSFAAEHRGPMIIFGLGVASLIVTIISSMILCELIKFVFKQHARKILGV